MEENQEVEVAEMSLKELNKRGFELIKYLDAVLAEDGDKITLLHPSNFMSEEEVETFLPEIMTAISTINFWRNRAHTSYKFKRRI